MKKRAIIVGILFGIGVWGLSGCKNAGESTASMEDNVVETTETLSEESVFPEDLALEENAEPEELMHESRKPATVLEDESAVYFCGGQRIVKWNKATQQTEIVWIKDETQVSEDAYAFREGKGILIGDKIYFIESWLAEPANPMASLTEYALSVISTDGNLYQQIEKVSGEERLLLLDGILYFACDIESGALEGYVVGANGELLVDKGKVVTMPANVPQGYTDMSYNDNGIQILTAQESAYNFGYYMLRDENYSLCRVNQDTGEKEIIPDKCGNLTLFSMNQNEFLMADYMEDKIYLMDTATWELNFLIDMDNNAEIIHMDEEYVYWQRYVEGDDFSQTVFERISLEAGVVEELFVVDSFAGMIDYSSRLLMDVSVINNYLYYVGMQDYKYYLMRRDVNMPGAEEVLGEAFFDSGIGQIGEINVYKEKIYSEVYPEDVLGEIDIAWLSVDAKYPGADAINKLIEKERDDNIAYEHDMAVAMEDMSGESIESSFSSNISPIQIFNERYISYTQRNYDYTGGAHGMPYWVGHTFDLTEGRELGLSDIVANTEEEFKEIVTAKFEEMYNVEPEMYWSDAIESVREWTTMESAFYLGKEGVVIYYGPYDLAPYAAGFQEIVVLYEDLELFIPLN